MKKNDGLLFCSEWLSVGIVFRMKHEDKTWKDQVMGKGVLERGDCMQPRLTIAYAKSVAD